MLRESVCTLFESRTRLIRTGQFDYDKLPYVAQPVFRLVSNVFRAVLLDNEVAVGLNAPAM